METQQFVYLAVLIATVVVTLGSMILNLNGEVERHEKAIRRLTNTVQDLINESDLPFREEDPTVEIDDILNGKH